MNEPLRLSPRDLWLLALLTLAWGVNWPIMKIGVNELAPMSFRALTMIGGLPALAVIARVGGRRTIVNSSRAILYASRAEDFASAASRVARTTRDALRAALAGC